MHWLKNTWYALAWADTVLPGTAVAHTLLDEPIALYRTQEGRLAAIGGRCPHRFAPLAMGRVHGDALECPYHGLRFGPAGACVLNPHGDGRIPAAARVREYPVHERWGLVWCWPGDEEADASLIPALSHLERTDLGHVRGQMPMQAHYLLGVDNLIDLSHAQFVHGDRLGSAHFAAARHGVEQVGNRVTNRLAIAGSDVPPMLRGRIPQDVQAVDYWLDSTWQAPSIVTNDVGVTRPGRPRDEGWRSFGLHIVTPATRHGSLYLYAHSRSYGVGDPEMDAKIREWQRVGFGEQDKPIIEATARMMGDEVDPLALRPVLLPTDGAAVRARRILAGLVDQEQGRALQRPG